MKLKKTYFLMFTLILLGFATTTYAQIPRTVGARRIQIDDGNGHYSTIDGSATGGAYTLQSGGGMILTTGGGGGSSSVWLLGGNTAAGVNNLLGTLDATDLKFITGAGGPNTRMTILGSGVNAGNIGIGTTSPSYIVDIVGTGGPRLRVKSNDGIYAGILAENNTHQYFFGIQGNYESAGGITSGFHIYDNTAGARRMVIDATGNMGIGSSNPLSLLSVGASNQFQVNASGDVVKLKNVTYSWPSSNAAFALANDGAGNLSWTAAALSRIVETYSTSAPYDAVNRAGERLQATGAATNISLALSPQGNGSLIANLADNTAAGGNIRGSNAVDWQLLRAANTQVASGPQSVISGGESNTASGNHASLVGGQGNQSLGDRSFLGGGLNNVSQGFRSVVGGGEANNAANNYATISGGFTNTAIATGATVAGGQNNTASNNNATVVGGVNNTASGAGSFIGGGGYDGTTTAGNTANGNASTITGGLGNKATDDFSTVAGGSANQAGDNAGTTADHAYATVAGGQSNTASGQYSYIGGGQQNTASSSFGTVGGGFNNQATGIGSTVAGGGTDGSFSNPNRAIGDGSYVGGGFQNLNYGHNSVISGGVQNTLSSGTPNGTANATISGGVLNTIAVGAHNSVVGGGQNNNVSGIFGTIGGGLDNKTTDNYSTVAGGQGNLAGDNAGTTADHAYATVGGGKGNTASGIGSFVGGGGIDGFTTSPNTASGGGATIGGGTANSASGYVNTVSGGFSNSASNFYATISGGEGNTASGQESAISGGSANRANAFRSAITGGTTNTIGVGGTQSTIAGGAGLTLNGASSFGFHAGAGAAWDEMIIAASKTAVFGNVDMWLANTDNSARALRFYQAQNTTGAFPTATVFYSGFKASATAQSDNYLYTWPSTAPSANQSLMVTAISGTAPIAATLGWVNTPSGSGTTNTIPKWTSANALGNSGLTDNGATLNYTINTAAANDRLLLKNTGGNSGIGIDAASGNSYIDFRNAGAKEGNIFYDFASNSMRINDPSTAAINLVMETNGGKVGIGTTTPTALFSVGTGVTTNLTIDASGNISTGTATGAGLNNVLNQPAANTNPLDQFFLTGNNAGGLTWVANRGGYVASIGNVNSTAGNFSNGLLVKCAASDYNTLVFTANSGSAMNAGGNDRLRVHADGTTEVLGGATGGLTVASGITKLSYATVAGAANAITIPTTSSVIEITSTSGAADVITMPAVTAADNGRIIYIHNGGANPTIGPGPVIANGATATFVCSGAAWQRVGP